MDRNFFIGLGLGAIGVSVIISLYPKIITKKLLSINWGPTSPTDPTWHDVHRVPKGTANAEKFGTVLEVAGQSALHLLDTGTYMNRVTISKQTAARLQIEQQFSKSSITTKTGKNVIVYGPVPITIPGMPQATVHSPLEIGDTNLVNPSIFLKNVDITFVGNTVTFSEKNTFRYPGSIFVPFSKRDKSGRVFFNCKVGNGRAITTIDTGASTSTTLNQEVADRLEVEHFPISNQSISKTRNHLVPVSFSGTSINFISTMSTNAGHYDSKTTEWNVLISGTDLLHNGYAFTMRDEGWDFAYVGLLRKPRALQLPNTEPLLSTRAMDLTRTIVKQYPTLA